MSKKEDKKLPPKMMVGFEVECEVSDKAIRNGLKYGWISKDWFVKDDCSLNTQKWDCDTFEIVSRPCELKDARMVLENLNKDVFRNEKFSDVININSTCGNHIHVSFVTPESKASKVREIELPERNHFYNLQNFEHYVDNTRYMDAKTKAHFRKIIKDYCLMFNAHKAWGIKGEHFKPEVTPKDLRKIRNTVRCFLPQVANSRYYRDYATSFNSQRKFRVRGERQLEWNKISDSHFEYRSFNLAGVKNWKEFIEIYMLTLDTIYHNIIVDPIAGRKKNKGSNKKTKKKKKSTPRDKRTLVLNNSRS